MMREHLISGRVAYEYPIFKVEHAIVELPGGERQSGGYAINYGAVGVVAVEGLRRALKHSEVRERP